MPDTEWHGLESISGIGHKIATDMTQSGFLFAESLLMFPPLGTARELEPVSGVTMENCLVDFIPQARLLRIPGMSVAAMRVFHEHRIYYERLAFADAGDLSGLLSRDHVEHTMVEILGWQLHASRLLGKASVYLIAETEDGSPASGASIFLPDPPKLGDGFVWRWTTQEDGLGFLEYLSPGLHEIVVTHNDKYQKHKISVSAGESVCIRSRLNRDSDSGVIHDERTGGVVSNRMPWIRRTVDDLDAFAPGEVFEVTDVTDDLVRLSTVLRKQEGGSWVVESVLTDSGALPDPVEHGGLYELSERGFVALAGSAEEHRRALRFGNVLNRLSLGGGR